MRRQAAASRSGVEERRAAARLEFSAPVTVMDRAQRSEPLIAAGKLLAISGCGAFFRLERRVSAGDRLLLYVHCEHPTKGQVRICFPAEVVRVCRASEWEVAVRFRGRHRFFLDSLDGLTVQ